MVTRLKSRLRRFDVGLRKIIPLVEQGHARMTRAGVGEVVAEVERCWVPRLSEALMGVDRRVAHCGVDRNHSDVGSR